MASGHVSRANRPNTWPHRPMLLHRKKSLPTRSRPHMALSCQSGMSAQHRCRGRSGRGSIKPKTWDPYRTSATAFRAAGRGDTMLPSDPEAGMRRRDFIAGIVGTAVYPFVARAQGQSKPVVGFLDARSADVIPERLRAFREGLKDAGYIDGENVELIYRFAENQVDRLPALAGDLVHRKVSVIATAGDDVAALAKVATSTIPIAFIVSQDPVKMGLVASLSHPSGNMTGINFVAGEVVGKRIELLRALLPSARRIAILVNPSSPRNTELTLRELEPAAQTLKLDFLVFNAATRQEIDAVFEMFSRERPDGLFVSSDVMFSSRRVQLVTLSTRLGIPAVFPNREVAEIGGLMSYGTNISDAWRQSGVNVGRILNGEKPAEMPVLQANKFEFVINVQTARALGLTVPQSLLIAADEVIE
jgi:putative tryptophan/tyrosine transport system substrate-binding protein